MIINFVTTTTHVRTGEKTYWFTVRIPGYEYTSLDVGFSKDGEWVSASASVFELEPNLRNNVIAEASKMVPKVV